MIEKLDFCVSDIQDVYDGPVGMLWELLMGEQIHVGGAEETDILAAKAGVSKASCILDVCSALGGPARHLAGAYGCRVIGLDITGTMLKKSIERTHQTGLDHLVSFKQGNALDMPFKAQTFDIVWGQDAWCYVTDKDKLLQECFRVLKPGGVIAFTDWLMTEKSGSEDMRPLNTFMVFPYMETLHGYAGLLAKNGFSSPECEALQEQFTAFMHVYQKKYREELKDSILSGFGRELYEAGEQGLALWVSAAEGKKVTRGRFVAAKPR